MGPYGLELHLKKFHHIFFNANYKNWTTLFLKLQLIVHKSRENSIKLTINPLPKADGPLWDNALFIGMASWYNCSRLADLGAWTRRSADAILLFLMLKASLIGEDWCWCWWRFGIEPPVRAEESWCWRKLGGSVAVSSGWICCWAWSISYFCLSASLSKEYWKIIRKIKISKWLGHINDFHYCILF